MEVFVARRSTSKKGKKMPKINTLCLVLGEVSRERNKDCRNEGLMVYKKAVEEEGRAGMD